MFIQFAYILKFSYITHVVMWEMPIPTLEFPDGNSKNHGFGISNQLRVSKNVAQIELCTRFATQVL